MLGGARQATSEVVAAASAATESSDAVAAVWRKPWKRRLPVAPGEQKCFLCGGMGHVARGCAHAEKFRRSLPQVPAGGKRQGKSGSKGDDEHCAAVVPGKMWFVKGTINRRSYAMAVDTGAAHTIIRSSLYDASSDGPLTESRIQLRTASNEPMPGIKGVATVLLQLAGASARLPVVVCDNLCTDVLLGSTALLALGVSLHPGEGYIQSPHGSAAIQGPPPERTRPLKLGRLRRRDLLGTRRPVWIVHRSWAHAW
jgi:hypothetical protein